MNYSTSPNSRGIPSLYALKAICACFVIILHFDLIYKEVYKPILVVAVPVFLMITGYFFYRKAQKSSEPATLKKMFWHALLITAVVNLVYLTKKLFETDISTIIESFNLINFLIDGRFANFAYWYLMALTEALLILYLLFRYVPRCITSAVMYLLPLLAIGSVIYGTYYGLVGINRVIPAYRSNAISVGLPCIAIGYLLAKHESFFKHLTWQNYIPFIFVATSFIEKIVASYLPFPTGNDFRFSTYPLAASIMLWCILHPHFGERMLAPIGKFHSANMYYVHILTASWIAVYIPMTETAQEYMAIYVIIASLLFSSLLNHFVYPIFRKRAAPQTTSA